MGTTQHREDTATGEQTQIRTLPVGYQYLIRHLQEAFEHDSWLCSRFYHADTVLRQKVHQQPEIVAHASEREMEHLISNAFEVSMPHCLIDQ